MVYDWPAAKDDGTVLKEIVANADEDKSARETRDLANIMIDGRNVYWASRRLNT